ncbi:MAG TPA: lysozyme inhibitor LprI family protein [Terriglobales bacterium]|nr:lysozyme inhibitor LprI family protein [Terriglobales bacterium]
MSRIGMLSLVMALAGCLSVLSAQETKDPIDKDLDACLNSPSGSSTAGQSHCAAKAYTAWDAELNSVYQKLMHKLDPASRNLLRSSQHDWLAFREAEKKFQAAPWREKGGTLIGVSVNLDNVAAVRTRVQALRTYAAVAK